MIETDAGDMFEHKYVKYMREKLAHIWFIFEISVFKKNVYWLHIQLYSREKNNTIQLLSDEIKINLSEVIFTISTFPNVCYTFRVNKIR